MVLMRVDLPQPFGPRMATCSPIGIDRVMRSSTIRLPRNTVASRNSSRGSIKESGSHILRSRGGPKKAVEKQGGNLPGAHLEPPTLREEGPSTGKKLFESQG